MRLPIRTKVRILDGSNIRTKCNLYWNGSMSHYVGMETMIIKQQSYTCGGVRKRVYLNLTRRRWIFSEEWLEKVED